MTLTLIDWWRNRVTALYHAGVPVVHNRYAVARNCTPVFARVHPQNKFACDIFFCPFCYGRKLSKAARTTQVVWERSPALPLYLLRQQFGFQKRTSYDAIMSTLAEAKERLLAIDRGHAVWINTRIFAHRRERDDPKSIERVGEICLAGLTDGEGWPEDAELWHPNQKQQMFYAKRTYNGDNKQLYAAMKTFGIAFRYPAAWLLSDAKEFANCISAEGSHRRRWERFGALRNLLKPREASDA